MLGMTPGECLERHSSEELSEWIAFDREYGLPDIYFLAAVLAPAILAPYSKSPPKPEDFVPFFAPPRVKKSTADLLAHFERISMKAKV